MQVDTAITICHRAGWIYANIIQLETTKGEQSAIFELKNFFDTNERDYASGILDSNIGKQSANFFNTNTRLLIPIPRVNYSVLDKIAKTMRGIHEVYRDSTGRKYEGEVGAFIDYETNYGTLHIRGINFVDSICEVSCEGSPALIGYGAETPNAHYHPSGNGGSSYNDIINHMDGNYGEHLIFTYNYEKDNAELWFHKDFRIEDAIISIAPKPKINLDMETLDTIIIPKLRLLALEHEGVNKEFIFSRFSEKPEWRYYHSYDSIFKPILR